jgi:hypothetical protein
VVEPGGIDFSRWYTDERDRLVRSLLVIGGDAEAARDAVAEAFSRAYERWRRVSTMASPTGWVYRVALNELRRRGRRRRLESRLLGRKAPPQHAAPPDADPELWLAVAADFTGYPYPEEEACALVYGFLPPGAETVVLVHDDGRTVTDGLVVEPTRRFWAMPIQPGDNPETVIYRDAAGAEVARYRLGE